MPAPRSALRVSHRSLSLLLLATLAPALLLPASALTQVPDLILTGGSVWTGDPQQPRAEAVAVAGETILAVGSAEEIAALRGPSTRLIDLDGAFLAPGFIDNHTHFNRAGELLLGVNLLAVADEESFVEEMSAARDRLPEGAWIVGGDWGAYEAWGRSSTGRGGQDGGGVDDDGGGDDPGDESDSESFSPDRSLLDPLTPDHPTLLSRWDRSVYLANGRALEAAGATCAWDGVECEEGDDGTLRATGRLTPEAAEKVREAMPPKPMEQRLAEARLALERLASHGVTSFHDITPPEQMEVFQELRARGELTARVHARPTLEEVEELAAVGIRHGFGDEWLEIGGLKGFVDGIMGNSSARFYEPYLHSGERGSWRDMMSPPGNMERLIRLADRNGHQPHVHAIGDEAIDVLLDLYERVMEDHGPLSRVLGSPGHERRWRVIHTQVLRGPEVADRMARLGVIAEVQPYHCIDDMRWMEERIGERSRWAYAFKTLLDAGVVLSFGSDWPGTNASWYPASAVLGIYAAVTRQTLEGTPEGGWYPQERVDLETALRAYTVNNAWAAGHEESKGSITPGKLADLVVLDRDPFEVEPEELKDLEVRMTVVGGEIVWEEGDYRPPTVTPLPAGRGPLRGR